MPNHCEHKWVAVSQPQTPEEPAQFYAYVRELINVRCWGCDRQFVLLPADVVESLRALPEKWDQELPAWAAKDPTAKGAYDAFKACAAELRDLLPKGEADD